jgi:hypothetical protein
MSAVRPEFGPTLPELLAPRLRALPGPARLALGVLAAALVLVILWALLLRGPGGGQRTLLVHRPTTFNFTYAPPLVERAPHAGELARVTGRGQSFVVRDLRLPAYRGDSSGFLPIWTTRVSEALARRLPGYQWRYEGRANVNGFQGYELVYQYRPQDRLMYGRRVFLLPLTTDRRGVQIDLLARRSGAVPRADAIGRDGVLKLALRSFRFGTDGP